MTETYTFTLPDGYRISSISTRHPKDVSVSIGRVLGDRSVLYKYLNPHLLAVTAVDLVGSAAIFLLDDVSGRVLYSAYHTDEIIDVSAGVKVVVGENWVVYSYWSDLVARGEKLVVLDLYESDIANERWSKTVNSTFTATPAPYVQSQAYLFPTHISSLAVTRSRFGITNRDVIAALDTNQVAALPKRILDARRPVSRDPTNEEKEEGLVKYDPLITDDRRLIISHVQQVILGASPHIISTPALLESTVLVFTSGIDLFFTRVTPSQPFDVLAKSFNKGQLVTTILALAMAVRVVGPMVKKKAVNARWGSTK